MKDEVVDSDFTVKGLASSLPEWEAVYNRVRPHQALGYLTPAQWLVLQLKDHQKTKDETERPSFHGRTNRPVPCSAQATIPHPVKKGSTTAFNRDHWR